MSNIVAAFKALKLTEMAEAYPHITEAFNQAKERRRQELEAEIRGWGFKPGEVAKKPSKVKYRGPNGETWSGVGALAGWLKKLKDAGEDVERYRVT